MGLKFKLKTTNEQLGKMKADFVQRYNLILRNELVKLGLDIVTMAREKQGHSVGGFDDQTGNLRASIGYVLLYDGLQVESDFDPTMVNDPIEEGTGDVIGYNYATKIAKSYPKGWCLVIVAGMEYATYVEDKGYDVISGSTMNASKMIKQVANNIDKAFN